MGHRAGRQQLLAVSAALATGIAYWGVVTALNAPDGARASGHLAIVPLKPPKPGTYAVRVTMNGAASDGTELVGADGTRRVTIGASVRGTRLRWAASRVELVQSGAIDDTGACVWAPRVLSLVANLAEGRTWSSDSSCTTSAGRRDVAALRRQETAKVTGRTRTQIGADRVDAWSIERHVIITRTRSGKTDVTEEASTELFAPSLGMSVNRIVRTDISRADGSVVSAIQFFELTSATPT